MSSGLLIQGDARHIPLADESVQCVVTSPPYWYLRDYGVAGQIGLEASPAEYVATIVETFREVWRVLRSDGTCWVNLGDTYASGGRGGGGSYMAERGDGSWQRRSWVNGWRSAPSGLKNKDLVGIPWRVAFALQDDGWYLRSDIIWSKPNPMPESVIDRPTKAHEYLFLLSKRPHYYYDADAIREPSTGTAHDRGDGVNPKAKTTGANSRCYQDRDPIHSAARKSRQNESFSAAVTGVVADRNARTVWTIATESFPGAHFATFPTALVKPCILAGTSERGCCPACGAPWRRVVEARGGTIGKSWHDHANDLGQGQRVTDPVGKGSLFRCGEHPYQRVETGWQPTCACGGTPVPCTVLDPFVGAGTTGLVASRLDRHFVGLELSREYCLMAQERISSDAPLLHPELAAEGQRTLSLFGAER